MAESPAAQFRADYRPPAFLVDTVDLRFDLDPEATVVRSRLAMRRNPAASGEAVPLRLDGDHLTLLAVALDGRALARSEYELHGDGTLELATVPAQFVLEIETYISPQANAALSGLYVSGGAFFTQCEAQGFRRITYLPDRPDVMAIYSTTLIADAARYPVLLSNGNLVAAGRIGYRHWTRWVDPHPKPSYLFALVAGDLIAVRDQFVTQSGRAVALAIWVRDGDQDRCGHAMQALKAAMRWDEEVYGLEYDLDMFNIAAVADFNMGAMENKGLNIFNTKYVLARAETATDSELEAVEAVVAHEYFHNWTGNRITCRDWFQLSLKEGLTVFRDQQFSADRGSAALQRIREARRLRTAQYPEDAGPLAHPVRPDSYLAVDNLYTTTVYEKGAEIVRMLHTVVGPAGFRRGMDFYVARHDNRAATIEDFLRAMQDAADDGVDIMRFLAWYSRPGTPELVISDSYAAEQARYTLTVRQVGAPLPIPLAMAVLAHDGRELATRTVVLDAAETQITFDGMTAAPVPSLLRGFSAPVKLSGQPRSQLLLLAQHDRDSFVRWDATQQVAMAVILAHVTGEDAGDALGGLAGGLAAALRALTDPALVAELLALPATSVVMDQITAVDPVLVHQARQQVRTALATQLQEVLQATYDQLRAASTAGARALRNGCLWYLAALGQPGLSRATDQFAAQANMTDVLAALEVLVEQDHAQREAAIATFYAQWRSDPLVLDKWFSVQAASPHPQTGAVVRHLADHADFSLRNPNRVRALLGAFSGNAVHFHALDGSGYQFLADMVLAVDRDNGQTAARLVTPLTNWRRYEPGRSGLMRAALERIAAQPGLSGDTGEKVVKALA